MHNLSDGRLILGAGVGWLEPEFAALGVPFKERGRRMDEGIAMMRAVWTQDPVTFEAKYIPAKIVDMTMTPQPISHIPLWIGGSSDAALKRTDPHRRWLARQPRDAGGGSADRAAAARGAAGAGSPSRCGPSGTARIRASCAIGSRRIEAVGVQHVLIAPENREVDDWDEVIEGAGRMVAG